jgi:hypothetical protein
LPACPGSQLMVIYYRLVKGCTHNRVVLLLVSLWLGLFWTPLRIGLFALSSSSARIEEETQDSFQPWIIGQFFILWLTAVEIRHHHIFYSFLPTTTTYQPTVPPVSISIQSRILSEMKRFCNKNLLVSLLYGVAEWNNTRAAAEHTREHDENKQFLFAWLEYLYASKIVSALLTIFSFAWRTKFNSDPWSFVMLLSWIVDSIKDMHTLTKRPSK